MDPTNRNIKHSQDLLDKAQHNMAILSGPELSQWKSIDLDRHAPFLHNFTLPKDLKFCLSDFLKQIPPLPQKITPLDKQLDVLKAAVADKSLDIIKAEAESIKLKARIEAVHTAINQAQKSAAVLSKASETIKNNLNIHTTRIHRPEQYKPPQVGYA